jgi:hypothetical protein
MLISHEGNARLQGLESELHLVGNQFNIALVRVFVSSSIVCLAHAKHKTAFLDDVLHCMAELLLLILLHISRFLSHIVSLNVQQS